MAVLTVVTKENPFTFKLQSPLYKPLSMKLFSLCIHKQKDLPDMCFVRCDLINDSKNLYNGHHSDILALFHTHDSNENFVDKSFLMYKQTDSNVFRPVSSNEKVYSLTLSITDNKQVPIVTNGDQIIYEIELN